ncbi:uncharacterized protein NPIL_128591 [Nephila pilipes]|uniref:Uncharacterized protein n=1 Tax=Nephila pilipes TaxID=299642 RepID=A0A8X6NP38_NEPPI|nr:uncharacterized protein NPIL_128591 [Nephila pilipes]
MALQQREICKVGESPSARRRSLSPRRGSGPSSNEENPDQPGIEQISDVPKSSKLSSPSSSAPEVRSPSKNERRISTRLLMQKGEKTVDPKQNKSPKHAAWKSSKFFSRSMASGELLKGFKKLSTATPVTSIVVSEEDGNPTAPSTEIKESEAKTFKSRFSSLRRKSGSDSDSVPNVDSESLKHGSADVRGIVCKKEDLLHLMSKVPGTKERRVSSPAELIVPVASSLPTSPIPVLKSPSLKVAPNSPLTRGSFRSSRSASLDPTTLPNVERPTFKLPNKPAIRTSVYQPAQPNRQGSKKTTDDICIKKTGAFLEVVPEVKRRLSGPLIEVKDKIVEENEEGEGDGTETPVQWDDSNFVDPNLLGGAIEAFLKGMGSSPTPTPTTEKRVSFKKNLIK